MVVHFLFQVDLVVMVMKTYTTLRRFAEIVPQYQMQISVSSRASFSYICI